MYILIGKTYPKKGLRKPWTGIEKDTVKKELHRCFLLEKLPSKRECEELINKEPCLKERSWTMIKGFVRTTLASQKRQIEKKRKEH
jgi:hypothetical protein